MNTHRTVVDLPPVAIVLTADSGCTMAALRRARFVDDANGARMCVVLDHDFNAPITDFFFIPLDGFQKSL